MKKDGLNILWKNFTENGLSFNVKKKTAKFKL